MERQKMPLQKKIKELSAMITPLFKRGGGIPENAFIKATLYERPDMENPVYKVSILGKDRFIQKMEGFSASDSAWYEVIKNDMDNWEPLGGTDMSSTNQIGDTKEEAVHNLLNKYRIKSKIMALGGQISETTLGELDKAKSDLHKAEKMQKMMKDANSIIRSKKNVTERLIKEAGLSEPNALKIQQPDFAGRIGFATYQLTNNNANIKRLQDRVNMLEQKVKGAEAVATGGSEAYNFAGGNIDVNYVADRVQIFFDAMPSTEQRTLLKGSGWHWSPTNKAWQRKITPQAIYNSVRMFGATKTVGEQTESVEEPKHLTPNEIGDLLEKRKFAYVSGNIYGLMPEEYTGSKTFNLVYLDGFSQGVMLEEIKKYFKENLPEIDSEKIKINIYPKTYIRESKELVKENKYLPNKTSSAVTVLSPMYQQIKNFFALEKDMQKREDVGEKISNLHMKLSPKETKVPEAPAVKTEEVAPLKEKGGEAGSVGVGGDVENTAKRWGLEYSKSASGSMVYNGEIKGLQLDPTSFKRSEFEGQENAVKRIGAKNIDLSEPIKATIFSDGTIQVQDGHHRLIAANELGEKLKVDLTFKNTKPESILSNPELVKAVEQSLKETTKAEKPQGEVAASTEGAFKGIHHDYANQYELNKAIEALLTSKAFGYSSDEKNFIRKYSGYGGLDKYGTTGKGGLFEYYTPKDVIEKMWALAYKYGYNNGSVLEPSVATGEFLQFAKPETRVVGYEINNFSAQICKILYPTVEIFLQPFEQLFIKNNWTMKDNIDSLEKFDLVIGNPPYGDFSIVASRYMTGMGEKDHTQAKNYVEYFIRRGIDLLKPKGLLIFIVGAQVKNGGTLFLDSGNSPVKEYLQKNCNFLDAYRLPDSIFERTGVTSEIIILQKN